MPLRKRAIFDSSLYGPPDIYEDSSSSTILPDINMSGFLGVLYQIQYLSLYSMEVIASLLFMLLLKYEYRYLII